MPHNLPIGKSEHRRLEQIKAKVLLEFAKITKKNDDDLPPPAATGDRWLRPEAA